MENFIEIGIIFTLFFFIRSLWLNYSYTSSLVYLFQIELIGLLAYNDFSIDVNNCIGCINSFVEWLLLGWVGLPHEITTIDKIEGHYEYLTLLIMISWIISYFLILGIKTIHYCCKNNFVTRYNIYKISLRFLFSNYTPLLLWSMASLLINNNYHYIKFWFEFFCLFLFLGLLFGLPSLYFNIMFGSRRVINRSHYTFLFRRYKKNKKLWLMVILLFKILLLSIVPLQIYNEKMNFNRQIINYIIYFIFILYFIFNEVFKPYKKSKRNDAKHLRNFNILTTVYLIINEISVWIPNHEVFWILKTIIIVFYIIYLLSISFINYFITRNEIQQKKDIENYALLELQAISDLDI